MDDSLKSLERFLEDFSYVFKLILLYPEGHPLVNKSIRRIVPIISNVLELEDPLSLRVSHQGFLWGGEIVKTKKKEVEDLNAHLHERGIGAIKLHRGLAMEELENFFRILCCQDQGQIFEEYRHIELVYLDYGRLFKDSPEDEGTPASEEEIWNFLLRIDHDIPNDLCADEKNALKNLAQQPETFGKLASDLMASIVTPDGSPMIQFQSDALKNWLDRLSKLFERFVPEGKDGFLENFSHFLPELDPALLFNLSEQDGVIQSALGRLSPHEIAELSLRILPMEGEVSPRLVKFLTRILSQEEKREEALTLMEDKVSGSWLEDLFSTAKELIFSSNEREFMSEGYEASLDAVDPFLDNPYKESFQKEEEYRVLNKFVSTLLFLLEEETSPQEYIELASELKEIAKDAILFGHFSLCARILRTFNEHYESHSLMPKETLQVLKDSLEDFKDGNLVQELILSISQVSEEDFGSLQEIFSAIGTASLKGLLNLLISERTQKMRKRVKAILSSLRKEALPSIFPLLSHENPILLRDLIEIMGNIGHERSLSHLEKFLKDKNPILRLEAVKSLGKIGGRRGAGILIKALKQRDNEVRKLAALYISRMKDKEVVHELISQAIEKNPFGSVIRVEIVKLLGQMKSVEAVPFLEGVLKKRFLLGKSKGYQATINALAKIGKGEALRVLQEGTASKRRLIRQECQKALKVVSGRLPQNV